MPGSGHAPPPPKAKGYPLLGNTPQILRRPWDFIQTAYQSLGPAYRISVLGRRAVVLAGPDVRDLYSEAGDNFLERAFFYEPLQEQLGASELIFRTEGPRHRELRRCASLAFSRHLAAEHVPATASELVRFFDALDPGSIEDTLPMSGRALLTASGPMLADCDLRPHVEDAYTYAATMMEIAGRTRPPWAAWSPTYRRARRKSLRLGHRLLESWRRSRRDGKEPNHIVACFDCARDDAGKPLPDEDIVALIALSFVGLGVYISRVVSFMVYEIMRDQELRDRVIAEVDRAFSGGYTYEGLRDLDFLRAVYCETLRRYPIWFLIPFKAERDFEFAGKRIRREEILLISSVQEHFLPEYFPDPDRFDPDRCRPPRNEHLQRGAFAPFGHGGRRCVAAGQTEIMSLLFVAVLLHRTRFRSERGTGLKVRLRPLPAPHALRLRFDGMREPPPVPMDSLRKEPAPGRGADATSARLDWEEIETLRSVVDGHMEVRSFGPGAAIVREGEGSDAFYIIESGRAVVLRETGSGEVETVATLGPGDVIGEVGLLRGRPRNATVKVAPGSDFLVALKCSTEAYQRLLGALNTVGDELIELIRRRKVAASLGQLVPGADRALLARLVSDARFRRGRRSEVFVAQGDPADTFHVVERGRFHVVVRTPDGGERLVARLAEGDFFGEMGLLQDAPRNATVRVAADCDDAETLVLGKDAFLQLIEPGTTFRERIFEETAKRRDPGSGHG